MDSISFWLVALGAPLAVVIGNALIRWATAMPQSAPADIILALVVFDFAVVVQVHEFEGYVRSDLLRPSLPGIYGFLMIVGLMLWALAVFFVERRIDSFHSASEVQHCDHKTCPLKREHPAVPFPIASYFLSLFIPTVQVFGSMAPFAYGRWS